MRSVAEINAEYSKTVSELGLLNIQQAELPRRIEALLTRIYQLRTEHAQADAVEREVAEKTTAKTEAISDK